MNKFWINNNNIACVSQTFKARRWDFDKSMFCVWICARVPKFPFCGKSYTAFYLQQLNSSAMLLIHHACMHACIRERIHEEKSKNTFQSKGVLQILFFFRSIKFLVSLSSLLRKDKTSGVHYMLNMSQSFFLLLFFLRRKIKCI